MNDEDAAKVIEECYKNTRISYVEGGSFFGPKFRSINHLELGYSKMISNPITIIIEYIYLQYVRFKAWLKNVEKKLFPRNAKIWAKCIDSQLVGRVVYEQPVHVKTGIHHIKVEFWTRTRWLAWRKLGEGYSDKEGYIKIPFDLRQARNWKTFSLRLEVYEISHFIYKGNQPEKVFRRVKKVKIKKSNLIGMSYNLRQIGLTFWQYRTDYPAPRAVIADVDKDAPQYYSDGRANALMEQVIPFELTKIKHLEQIEFAKETISIKEIQQDYPVNLTVCLEKKLPGYTRGDAFFGMRMMNGMNRGYFLPDEKETGVWWIKYFGICNYEHNREYAFPTTEIKFKMKENGLMTPVKIVMTGQINAFDQDPWQVHEFSPESGEMEWLAAKRQARVSGAICTEVEEHFTGTHLVAEQYAIAAYRSLRVNPVASLLLPYLKEVVLINHSADKIIIKGFLPRATALTEKGIVKRTRDLMGVQDWKGWKPMEVISEAHSCAKAENLFWSVVEDYVDKHFEENEAGIKENWYEVYRFSEDLLAHSVPVFLSDVDKSKLSEKELKWNEERLKYYSKQYAFNPDLPRERINGELKVVSAITKADKYENAGEEDLQNLKDVCKHAIMIATYMHTWINEHQYDDLGEILYSGGGLRFGNTKEGIIQPESNLSIAPDLSISTQMLWFTNLLSRTEYGFITVDEEGDVSPVFKKLLEEKREEFKKLKVDIDSIESRTNI